MAGAEALRLSLPGVRLVELEGAGEGDGAGEGEHEGNLALAYGEGQRPLSRCSPGLRAALQRLCSDGADEAELVALVRAVEPDYPLPSLFFHLGQFERTGLLCRTVVLAGADLVTLAPITPDYVFDLPPLDEARPLLLSRFALLRREPTGLRGQGGPALVLESPTSHARIVVHDPRALALIHALAAGDLGEHADEGGDQGGGATPSALRAAVAAQLPASAVDPILRLLLGGGFVRAVVDGRSEDDDPALQTWSFSDLLFHSRSRFGRHDGPMGKVYPHLGVLEPPPAIRPLPPGPQIQLPRPDLSALLADDRGFTAVLESRTSIRHYGDAPITLAQLATLLYRAARVRGQYPRAPDSPYEFTNRPTPGGGGCYELELYLAIDRCAGLERGLYHYDPAGHRLTRVAEPSPGFEALLQRTAVATTTGLVAQVLVCIAARFQRMAWPYAGMAYATTLKNVGALMQTLYLVATAMELAPCGMGYGDSDLFARVAKTNYYAETTVGEFLLGSRPT